MGRFSRFLLCLVFAVGSASALSAASITTVFDNEVTGDSGARNAGDVFAIADDFSLTEATKITGVTFAFAFGRAPIADVRFNIGIYDDALNNLALVEDTAVVSTLLTVLDMTTSVYEAVFAGLDLDLDAGDYWFAFNGIQPAGTSAFYAEWGIADPTTTLIQSNDGMVLDSFVSTTLSRNTQFSLQGHATTPAIPLGGGLPYLAAGLGAFAFYRRVKTRAD